MSNLILISGRDRIIPGVQRMGPEFVQEDFQADAVLVEPVFHDFRGAGNNELGFPFMCAAKAQNFGRMVIGLSYTQTNAMVFKGYVKDIVAALHKTYPEVKTLHVPYITCGVPLGGSFLAVIGSHESWSPKAVEGVVMPSDYFPGLLSHVRINRPNFPIMVSSRSIGAVRSDLNLLPSVNFWGGRSLMCEYRKGATTSIERMKFEHVGKLFGVEPCAYTDDMSLLLPAAVVEAFK